jgi:outer membrane protein assembly factor BamB
MWTNFKRVALLAAFGINQTGAQLSDLIAPTLAWSNQIIPSSPTNSPGVLRGNGVYLTPDGMHLIATSVGGTVNSFNAATGVFEWEYDPPAVDGAIVRTHSGIAFTTEAASEDYMVYSIVDNENSLNSLT